jgi:uncharacterized protein YndB with AHSA1/START domain
LTAPVAIRVDRLVKAPPRAVYAHLTESALWARWQGVDADLEAVPGGLFRMTMANGQVAEGRFVELVPDRRVVFTWGWNGHPTVPPGSSTVEIELIPDAEGTLVRLTHRGLPPDDIAPHEIGWNHFLPRLAAVAQGTDPGPDRGPG